MQRITYLNMPGDMPNQQTINTKIKWFMMGKSLCDYYYQIHYTEADAVIKWYTWNGHALCLQGETTASSQAAVPNAVQSTHGDVIE
jgi:hypothetical protein